MTEKERLLNQIAEAQYNLSIIEEQEKNSQRSKAITELSEYTVEEKVKWFDSKYQSALRELREKENGDYCEDNDNDHYAWESDMEILSRNKQAFWDYWNSMD